MPRNGSGTYTLPAGNPVVAGTTIDASWANDTMNDLANEITNSLSRTGAGGMLAPFRVADGSVSAPGLAFTNETNSGLYRAGSGELWLAVGGVAVAQITANGLLLPAGKRITLPAPVNDADGANKEYVDDAVAPVVQYADLYLGSKTSDPTTNNSGGALVTGVTYWSSTLNQMRVYNGTNWVPMPTISSLVGQTFSGDGSDTTFTLANPTGNAINLEVFISGVRQVPTTDYSVSGTTLTFVSAPPSGTDNIFVRYAQLGTITDGAGSIVYTPAGTGAVATTVQTKLRESVSVKDFGAVGDGVTDDRAAIQAAIDAVGVVGGGVIDGSGLTYCIDSGNGCVVNYDNVLLQNFTFKRTVSANTGYTLRFATTINTNGGGVINAKFIGIPTVAAMAGLLMGSTTYKANNYVLENIESSLHGQYGVAIEAGDNWKISNIRVVEHGLTTGTISSCMGFYVYPKIASSGGQLNNVSSQISDACVANASANTAAIKLQTHQRLTAANIRAVYGSESCMVIDSVDGTISNVFVKQQATEAGLTVGNYNPAHSFSGQTFTLDGFVVQFGSAANNNEFVIGGGVDGQYKLTGCTIRNGKGGGAGYLALSSCKNCTFENLDFQDIRFSSGFRGYTVNSLASSGNTYRNISVGGGALTGTLVIETSNGVLVSCGGNAIDGDTVSSFEVWGSNNVLVSPFVRNCASNGVKIVGSNNELFSIALKDITGRSVWLPAGSDNNIVHSGDLYAGTGVLNSGSGNYLNGYKRIQYGSAAPATGTWAVGDIVYALIPTAGGYIGWVCTTAGTPGTWKQFGAILP